MNIELSGGPHGGETEEIELGRQGTEFRVVRGTKIYIYRHVIDPGRSDHAVFVCEEAQDAVQE